jgi:hypothetical protein
VRLGRIADAVGAGVEHELEQDAGVEAGAANEEVLRRPLAALVRSPGLVEPLAVGLEAAGRQHAGARLDPLGADPGRDEATAGQLEGIDGRVVADANAERLGAAVVGVDERLAAAHEEALVRARCSVPESGAWKWTPWRRIQSRQVDDARIAMRASASLVRPAVTLSRSCQYSSSE